MINSQFINSIQGTSTLDSSNAARQGNTLGKDDFLKLFMTQLKYQDPTKPLDIYQMSQQLSQYSTVEQLHNISDELEEMKDLFNNLSYGQMAGIIGKEIEAGGNTVHMKSGASSLMTMDLAKKASVKVNIFNQDGELIRTIDAGYMDQGKINIEWDGLMNSGQSAPDGDYSFFAEAYDENGNPVEISSKIVGTVEGVRMDSGKTYLIVGNNGALIDMNNVKVIRSVGAE